MTIDDNSTRIIIEFLQLLTLIVGAIIGYFKLDHIQVGQVELKKNVDGKMQQLLDSKDRESQAKQEAAGSAGELKGRDFIAEVVPAIVASGTPIPVVVTQPAEVIIVDKDKK